jgi:hypothetical protein
LSRSTFWFYLCLVTVLWFLPFIYVSFVTWTHRLWEYRRESAGGETTTANSPIKPFIYVLYNFSLSTENTSIIPSVEFSFAPLFAHWKSYHDRLIQSWGIRQKNELLQLSSLFALHGREIRTIDTTSSVGECTGLMLRIN